MRSAVPNCCGGGSRGENRACPLIENYREARSLPRMRGHTTGFVDSASQARERARRQAHRCPAVGNCRSRDWAGINAARTAWIEEQQLTRPLAEANLKLERSVEGSNCLTKAAQIIETTEDRYTEAGRGSRSHPSCSFLESLGHHCAHKG